MAEGGVGEDGEALARVGGRLVKRHLGGRGYGGLVRSSGNGGCL